jgi:hypothetical protein
MLAATDLIEVSEDLGGGLFGSKKLTGLQLRNGIKTYKAILTQTGTQRTNCYSIYQYVKRYSYIFLYWCR